MKKLIAIALLGMVSTSVVYADALNGAAGKKNNSAKFHPTDVIINNRSWNDIELVNPVYKFIESGAPERYTNGSPARPFITIRNYYNGGIIFNRSVCNKATIIIKGSYDALQPYLDESDCFKK